MAISVKIDGVAELLKQLGELDKGAKVVVRRAIKSSALRIQTAAKKLVPRSPLQLPPQDPSRKVFGLLRASIRTESFDKGMSARIGTNSIYAAAQEFGRREINLPARPYLGPAFEAEKPRVVNNIVDHLNRHMKRVAAKGNVGSSSGVSGTGK